MKSHRILARAVAILLGLVFVAGCQKADEGNYQEYSTLDNDGQDPKSEKRPAANGNDRHLPAIAEKRDQPAVAQASFERPDLNQTEPVSVNTNGAKALSRPGELVIAKPQGPPREIKLLVPDRRFAKASRDGTLRVTYDDIDLLKILNMDPVPLDVVDYLPSWLEQLEGQRIRIRGFMFPPELETGIQVFILARDNEICCFGRDPKVYDLIRVVMKEGTTTNYIPNTPFDVEGTFHIVPPDPDEFAAKLYRLYEIRDAKVITGR